MKKEIRFPTRSLFQALSLVVLLLLFIAAPVSLHAQDEPEPQVQILNGYIEIGEVIEQICQCQKGKPIRMDNYESIAKEFRLPANILHINTNA